MTFPCKNCELREIGCHSKCKQYNESKQIVEKSNKEKNKQMQIRSSILESLNRMRHSRSTNNMKL